VNIVNCRSVFHISSACCFASQLFVLMCRYYVTH